MENGSLIRGLVRAVTASPTRRGWDELTVRLDAAEPVEGKPNLLAGRVGEEYVVCLRRGVLPSTEHLVGRVLVAPASAEGPRLLVVAPHPPAGDVRVEPPPTQGRGEAPGR